MTLSGDAVVDHYRSTYSYKSGDGYIKEKKEAQNSDPESRSNGSFSVKERQPIYNGSVLTLRSAMLLVQLFAMRFSLPSEGISHLLSLLLIMLPQGHIFPKTLNEFRKSFLSLKNQLVFHYFCSSCLTCFQDKSVKQCPNSILPEGS